MERAGLGLCKQIFFGSEYFEGLVGETLESFIMILVAKQDKISAFSELEKDEFFLEADLKRRVGLKQELNGGLGDVLTDFCAYNFFVHFNEIII